MFNSWLETKKLWNGASQNNRKRFLAKLIFRKKISFEKIKSLGGVLAVIQYDFNGLPLFLCDAIKELRDLLLISKNKN